MIVGTKSTSLSCRNTHERITAKYRYKYKICAWGKRFEKRIDRNVLMTRSNFWGKGDFIYDSMYKVMLKIKLETLYKPHIVMKVEVQIFNSTL